MKSFLKNIFNVPVCIALLLSVLLTASVSGSEANYNSAGSSVSSSRKKSSDWHEINLLPLFYHNKEKTWIFPTFYTDNKRTLAIPFFFSEYSPDKITVLNVLLLLYNYEYNPESARHRHDFLTVFFLRYETYDKSSQDYSLSFLLGLLWSFKQIGDESITRVLGGLLFRCAKNSEGSSWSFCCGLFGKHDGGGRIFYIPYGKSEEE